jgi:(p)ppGpp synthase/HD superfamily hydrolase
MTPTFSPDLATQALKFAAARHASQKIPGSDFPYILHPVMVFMELIATLEIESGVDGDLAVQCALLHDVLEDTPTIYQEIEHQFSRAVAEGVNALSKDKNLPKEQQLEDSLAHIRLQPKEIWMVKLADRIANLAPPPGTWMREKCQGYLWDAVIIHEALKDASAYLGNRLLEKVEEYRQYC